MEIFESEDAVEFDPAGKRMATRTYSTEHLHIIHDRSYASSELQSLIEDIRQITSGRIEKEEKKALEPLGVLTIGGLFIAGAIASGLLSKAGADCWDLFKSKLKDLLKKRKENGREHLLMIQCAVPTTNGQTLFDTILTNPSDSDIEDFFKEGIRVLDKSVVILLPVAEDNNLARVVFEYSDKGLSLRFGVRRDAFPVTITLKPRGKKEND